MLRAHSSGEIAEGDVPPVIATRLAKLSSALTLSLCSDAFDGLSIRSATALMAYLRHDMAALSRETFRVLFLDGENRLLDDRVLWTGTSSTVQVHPREIVRAVLELGATAIILVHNHPSGNPRPSGDDHRVTQELVWLCRAMDVVVQDHVIVARAGVHSMRSSGELTDMQTPPTFRCFGEGARV